MVNQGTRGFFVSGKWCVLLSLCWLFFFLAVGCQGLKKDHYRNKKLGLSFRFPSGWSALSGKERQQFFPGKNYLVAIADPGRQAFVVLLDLEYRPEDLREAGVISNMGAQILGPDEGLDHAVKDLVGRYAVLTYGLLRQLEKTYGQFQLVRDSFGWLDGRLVREIVSTGVLNGRQSWRRVLIIIPPKRQDQVLMLFMAAPEEGYELFLPDFTALETTWRWD